MAEIEDILNEYRSMVRPSIMEVRFSVEKFQGFYLPNINGSEEIVAKFRTLTFDDHNIIYQMATKLVKDEKAKDYVTITDYMEMKKLALRRQLISWNLGIEIEYDGAWIREDIFERICNVSGPLLMKMLSMYEEMSNLTQDEEEMMTRQSGLLFSGGAGGVASPCEAVSMYCNLSRFWDKFGLNKNDLKELSYREYLMLRTMSVNDDEAQRRASKAASTTSNTRVAGKGGKIRGSRGVKVGGH
jgi:hypothetical protein